MKTCTLCNTPKGEIDDFYFYPSTKRWDTFCKSCRLQVCTEYSSGKGKDKTLRRHKFYYDQVRVDKYANKTPTDLARSMAVIVATIGKWRDEQPQKFTDFKLEFKGMK